MIPNWLNSIIDGLDGITFGIAGAIKNGLNSTNEYKEEILKLNQIYDSVLKKKGNEQEALAVMIDKLATSNLPFPSEAMRSLNQYKDKLMKQNSQLQNDVDSIHREKENRENLANMADSMPNTFETHDWYVKQKNNIKGVLKDENQIKEEEV